ncbi:MAG: ATP-binding protein [Chloroflexi bacterium]|nr:ATP-binding protein [Chloroflexota bacterium]
MVSWPLAPSGRLAIAGGGARRLAALRPPGRFPQRLLHGHHGLINELVEAQEQHVLGKRMAQMQKLDLLILDEVGFVPFTPEGARLLFQIHADRYLRGSLLITTNLEFGRWMEVFGDERLTGALLDRLTHRGHVLSPLHPGSQSFLETFMRHWQSAQSHQVSVPVALQG